MTNERLEDRPLGELHAGVNAMMGLVPAELSDSELAATIRGFRSEMDRQDAVFSDLVLAGHQRGVGRQDGFESTAEWLRARSDMRTSDVHAVIRLGELGDVLPAARAAWRDGHISTGAVRIIGAARVQGYDTELAAIEPELLDAARRKDTWSLGRMASHCKRCARRDGDLGPEKNGLRAAILGPDSLPMDVGNEIRSYPRWMRRAVAARDGHCRWPGCEIPPGWCETHHVKHWQHGGETSIANGVLLCSRHHHFLHAHPTWQVVWDQTTFRVFRPDSTEVCPTLGHQQPDLEPTDLGLAGP